MKKGRFSGFVLGVLVTLMIVILVVPALASTATVQKTISYKNISVSLDGEKLTLKDAKGNPVEPFIMNGTNYLPVRALAESLGLNVSWDSNTNTVVMKTGNTGASTSTDKLIADQSGVKIYYQGIVADTRYHDGYKINLKIINSSGKNITVQCRDFAVNNIMCDRTFSCNVANGKTAFDSIDVSQYDLDQSHIATVDEASFTLVCINEDTWDDMFETAEITVTK